MAAASSGTLSREARALIQRSASAASSMVPQSTTCASRASVFDDAPPHVERAADEDHRRVRRRALNERSSRASSSSAAFDSRFGMSSRSASSTSTTRRGAIIGKRVGGVDQRCPPTSRRRSSRSTLKACRSGSTRSAEGAGHFRLLDVVVAEQEIERAGRAGVELRAQRGRGERRHLEGLEDGGHDGAGDVGGDAIDGAALLVEERRAVERRRCRGVCRSYSSRNTSAVVRPEHVAACATSVNCTCMATREEIARRELLLGEADGLHGNRQRPRR